MALASSGLSPSRIRKSRQPVQTFWSETGHLVQNDCGWQMGLLHRDMRRFSATNWGRFSHILQQSRRCGVDVDPDAIDNQRDDIGQRFTGRAFD